MPTYALEYNQLLGYYVEKYPIRENGQQFVIEMVGSRMNVIGSYNASTHSIDPLTDREKKEDLLPTYVLPPENAIMRLS